MGQGEGIEGAGEKGDGPGLLKGEPPVEQALLRHKAVHPPQHGRPIVEGQGILGLLIAGLQQLLLRQQKGLALFMLAQAAGAEHPAAQDEHSLLPGAAVAAGQTLHQHAQQPLPAAAVGLRLLREPGPVGVVFLINHAHGVQGRGHHPHRCGVEGLAQVRQQLLQLGRRQPQGKAAQIVGDILGKLLLPQLQAPGQLHGHLVALVHRQPGGQGQQGVSGAVAHRDPVADLDEVGQVGGDVQHRSVLPGGVVLQQADVHLLQYPGGGGFQVVQENVGDYLLRQGLRHAALHDPAAQQLQGRASPAVDPLQDAQRAAAAGIQPVQPVHQQHGACPDGDVLPLAQSLGKPQQQLLPGPGQGRQRQSRRRVQQLEGHVVLQLVRMAVIGEEGSQEPLLPARAPLQQGAHGEFQGIADPPPVLGHQLVVRVDDLLQVQLPLVQVRGHAGVGAAVRRTLLGIARVEPGDDLAHQRRRLAADVPLPVHQQLIQKGQGLHLLGNVQIQGVGLEHPQIGPQPPPVGLAPGLLQQGGKAPLARQPMHQVDVVAHTLQGQGRQGLPVRHQGGVLFRQRRCVPAFQGHIHPPGHHELLEIVQPGVHQLIPPPLGLVQVVQLGQDHVEGLRQGENLRHLPALIVPGLLHPEIGVDQQQRLHRQIVQLQVPHGVVGGHMADIRHPPAAEPLVRVIVVQIRHPLSGVAAEFADVVADGAAGHQGQVQGYAPPAQGPSGGDGHMVDSHDVLQGPIGRHLQAQAHHFIHIFPLPKPQHLTELGGSRAVRQLLRGRGSKVPGGVIVPQLPLRVQQHLQNRQEKHRPGSVGPVPVLLRKQQPPGKAVAVRQPALPGLRAVQPLQVLPAQVQSTGAGYPVRHQRHKALEIPLAHQLLHQVLPAGQVFRRRAAGKPPQQCGVHLADSFSRHSTAPFAESLDLFLLCHAPAPTARINPAKIRDNIPVKKGLCLFGIKGLHALSVGCADSSPKGRAKVFWASHFSVFWGCAG